MLCGGVVVAFVVRASLAQSRKEEKGRLSHAECLLAPPVPTTAGSYMLISIFFAVSATSQNVSHFSP